MTKYNIGALISNLHQQGLLRRRRRPASTYVTATVVNTVTNVLTPSTPSNNLTKPAILWSIPGSAIASGAATGTIRFTYNGVTNDLTFPRASTDGTLNTAGWYYVSGDGQADDLCRLLQNCLRSHASSPTINVTQSGNGYITITDAGGNAFSIVGTSSTVDLTIWGMSNSATFSASGFTLSITTYHKGAWYPWQMQSDDSLDRLPFVGATTQAIDGTPTTVRVATERRERDFTWQMLDAWLVVDPLSASNALYATFQRAWEESIGYGYPWRFYPDYTIRNSSSYELLELRDDDSGSFPWQRQKEDNLLWGLTLRGSVVSGAVV